MVGGQRKRKRVGHRCHEGGIVKNGVTLTEEGEEGGTELEGNRRDK